MFRNIFSIFLALLLISFEALGLGQGQVEIIAQNGKSYHFKIEIAATAEERSLGLMYRAFLPADSGMLFIFPEEQRVGFWMKNTFIPLDMLFLSSDGRILQITKNATPLSEQTITSLGEVRYVLEINAGLSDQLGFNPGDKANLYLPGGF